MTKTKRDTKEMFASMPPWKLFFIVALPGMISMFTMSVYIIFEGVFIGHKLGEEAFAAVNIALPVVMINFSLADLIGVGASVPISIALGRKDEKSANNIFSCSVILIFIASLIMGSIMFFAAMPLAKFMGAEQDVAVTASKYIRTYALCSPLTTVFFAMDNYLRISGYIKTSMCINIFCNLSTMGLLALFLLKYEMDVAGSALAACISMCVCSCVAMIPFLRGKALLKFKKPRFNMGMIKEICACGSPVFLSNIAGRIASILMNIALVSLGVKAFGEGGGTTAVAAYAVLMYASDMCQPLLYGMSDSLAPSLGFNWGAGNFDRVKKIAKCNYIGALVISLITVGIMFFFSDALTLLFVNKEDTALRELAGHGLKLFAFTYVVRWFAIVTQSFLSAIEKPLQAAILSICTALIFPVITLAALWNMGLDGIWLNMLGTNVLSLVLGVALILTVKIKSNGKAY